MIGPTERIRIGVAHASVWLIWGSTYLGVRVLVQTVPPFMAMSSRFFAAGAAVVLYQWFRGVPLPTRAEWRTAMIGGTLMVAAGNGAVAYTEQTVPSNLVALTVALMPAWMVVFDWVLHRTRPRAMTLLGLALGIAGVAVLLNPGRELGPDDIPLFGAVTVMAGSMSWALGSILTRQAPRPPSVMMSTGAQMLFAGVVLLGVSALAGETERVTLALITPQTTLMWLYLVVAGSIVAYSAYVYLLHHTEPAQAGSYAFVNPMIAVVLGWALGGEPLNARIGVAAVLIVAAVALIVRQRQ